MSSVDFITNAVFNSRTYILSDGSDKVWLVDCGDVDHVIEKIGSKQVEGVLLTHTHSDHIYGIPRLLELFPEVKIFTNGFGKKALADPKMNISKYHSEYPDVSIVADKNIIVVSEGTSVYGFEIIETPGHDPSCLCYIGSDCIFTGDSYIPGMAVFTGFPKSDKCMSASSLKRILDLSSGRQVWPGHTV